MPNILVVDDGAVDRRLIGGLLDKDPSMEVCFAEDGLEALALMKESEPDLVLTDMLMPKMDGLKLTTAIGLHHRGVPVILITGQGSEEIAVDALAQGAASYVPKSRLNDCLSDTVRSVLARAQDDRSYERLIQCSTQTEFTFQLDNDPALIDPLVDLVQQIVLAMGVCDTRCRLRVGVALEHALLNAICHGNLEISYDDLQQERKALLNGNCETLLETRRRESPYQQRRTYVHVKITTAEAKFVVRDEGKGFDAKTIRGTGQAKALVTERGRGLVLMQTFMDEVSYNEVGNEVTMVKRKDDATNQA